MDKYQELEKKYEELKRAMVEQAQAFKEVLEHQGQIAKMQLMQIEIANRQAAQLKQFTDVMTLHLHVQHGIEMQTDDLRKAQEQGIKKEPDDRMYG